MFLVSQNSEKMQKNKREFCYVLFEDTLNKRVLVKYKLTDSSCSIRSYWDFDGTVYLVFVRRSRSDCADLDSVCDWWSCWKAADLYPRRPGWLHFRLTNERKPCVKHCSTRIIAPHLIPRNVYHLGLRVHYGAQRSVIYGICVIIVASIGSTVRELQFNVKIILCMYDWGNASHIYETS